MHRCSSLSLAFEHQKTKETKLKKKSKKEQTRRINKDKTRPKEGERAEAQAWLGASESFSPVFWAAASIHSTELKGPYTELRAPPFLPLLSGSLKERFPSPEPPPLKLQGLNPPTSLGQRRPECPTQYGLGVVPLLGGTFFSCPPTTPKKKIFRTSYFLYLAVGSARTMLEESATRGKRKKRKKPRRTDNEWSFLFTPPFLFFVFDRLL